MDDFGNLSNGKTKNGTSEYMSDCLCFLGVLGAAK